MKRIIKLTESDLHNIIKSSIIEIVKNEVICLNEGLIMSYDINTCKNYLQRLYPNIEKFVSLKQNPYDRRPQIRVDNDDFMGIVLTPDNVSNHKDISNTLENLLGWFTGCILLRQQKKNGFKEWRFDKFGDDYICYLKDNDEKTLESFLATHPKLLSFNIIVEAKFSEIYHQQPNEKFYHVTTLRKEQKILNQGICPRSNGNFPDRVYLGKDIYEIMDMVKNPLEEYVLLEVDVSDVKLYRLYKDQRNSTAVFTYDNIPPNKIRSLGKL